MDQFASGYPTELFVVEPKKSLLCPLCFEVFRDPHQCLNGHVFCFSCIERSINSFEECPVCRIQIYGMKEMSRSIHLSDEIEDLHVFCHKPCEADQNDNQDICFWVGALKDRRTHMVNRCLYNKFLECPIAIHNCLENCKRDRYESHAVLYAHLIEYSIQKEAQVLALSNELHAAEMNRLRGFGFAIIADPQEGDNNDHLQNEAAMASVYCGAVNQNGDKQGLGIAIAKNRISYIGGYMNNKMHGQGFYEDKDSHTHNGFFENDLRHGQCFLFTNVNGRHGKGMFRNDVMHGHGRIWSTEDRFSYTGDFENDKMHGYGTVIFSSGQKSFVGIFVDDVINGAGVLTCLVSKETLTGTFTGDLCNGKGVEKNALGIVVYDGGFKNGRRHGEGTLLAPDGSKYIGQFSNNRPHGTGVILKLNGLTEHVKYLAGIHQVKKEAKEKILVDLSDC
jgi:hypothetical protein